MFLSNMPQHTHTMCTGREFSAVMVFCSDDVAVDVDAEMTTV